MDFIITLILQFIAGMVGTLAFAVLFHAPKKEYFFCSLTGGIGWIVYYLFTHFGCSVEVASMIATFVLTLQSRVLAVLRKNPVTVFLVTGIFPLVPGAGIYYTSYYLIMNDFDKFSVKGTETFLVAGAITLGIIFGFAVPRSLFRKLKAIIYRNS